MTGAEARAILVQIFGDRAPTLRASDAIGVSRRKLQQLFSRKDRIPTVYALAIKQLRRQHATRNFADAIRQLEAEARELSAEETKNAAA